MLSLESIGKVTSAAIYIFKHSRYPLNEKGFVAPFVLSFLFYLSNNSTCGRHNNKRKQRRRMRHERHSQVEWAARWSGERGGEREGVRSLSRSHSCEGWAVRWWPLTMTQSTGMWVDASDARYSRYSRLSVDITPAQQKIPVLTSERDITI